MRPREGEDSALRPHRRKVVVSGFEIESRLGDSLLDWNMEPEVHVFEGSGLAFCGLGNLRGARKPSELLSAHIQRGRGQTRQRVIVTMIHDKTRGSASQVFRHHAAIRRFVFLPRNFQLFLLKIVLNISGF